ncbi:DegQ family serine endoprotease [Methylotetracoccus oryzae]|uniref:DegQ family serine endoprotease n=1 Tax=Methylotetracoccus oryzae TaxID=1919059 RepID=UPI001119A079|nr:DegQ family serine endoprotease [Methylotetracoccus oryzae]
MANPVLQQTLIAAAVAATVSGGLVYFSRDDAPQTAVRQLAAPTQQSAPSRPAMATLPNFAAIAVESGPAVVNISVSGTTKVSTRGQTPFGGEPPLSEFFRHFQPPMPQEEAPQARGMGSGFVIRPDGLIMTNAHVVDGASEVTVKLTDKREFPAKVIGIDKPTDLALLKIEAQGLPAVKLGNPDDSGVGDWVVAIGAPFGFENTVTAGIISAKSRSLPEEGYVPFLQTDVAVNPGNSGGPLFNLKGEVIGINSQIYSRTGGYQGLSFAIPIDVALKVEQQLVEHGKVSRGKLGIAIQDVNQALADSFGMAKPAGALVVSVQADGPGAKAGIEPGDVITELDGRPIGSSGELPPRVADLKPGTEGRLTVWRNGTSRELKVQVGALEDVAVAEEAPMTEPKGRLGLAVRPLTPEESQQAEVSGGLVVERVAGPAAKAGVRRGDVVLGANGQPIRNAEQLRELAEQAGKYLALLVQRGDARLFVPLELG